ncbi:MAG: YedE family putative selenium transporter, partial [Bacillota bacterium]|nr:YedE family putative selenium transporter [Bacillota bacterium]
EFSPRGGSSPFTRFVLSAFVMVGALMFLGCPLRLVLRLAGGDLNAILGLVGFVAGIGAGIFFLNKGFNLKKSYKLGKLEGSLFPITMIGLFALLVAAPSFLFFSQKGPGAAVAPLLLSLGIGLVVGALAQRTRLCTVGGIRDMLLFKDSHLLIGFIAIFAVTLVGNLVLNKFNLGFEGQPIAHADGLWNFLGMSLVGWASVLLGGCPLRQLILAGEGNTDSAVSVMGLIVGAAFAHNFALASSPAGPTPNGQIAVIVGLVVTLIISWRNSEFLTKA